MLNWLSSFEDKLRPIALSLRAYMQAVVVLDWSLSPDSNPVADEHLNAFNTGSFHQCLQIQSTTSCFFKCAC